MGEFVDSLLCTKRFFSEYSGFPLSLRTVPAIVIAHTFCASQDTRVSYRYCLLMQGYFWAA